MCSLKRKLRNYTPFEADAAGILYSQQLTSYDNTFPHTAQAGGNIYCVLTPTVYPENRAICVCYLQRMLDTHGLFPA